MIHWLLDWSLLSAPSSPPLPLPHADFACVRYKSFYFICRHTYISFYSVFSETVPGYSRVKPKPNCRQTGPGQANFARQQIKRSIETFGWFIYFHDSHKKVKQEKGESEKEFEHTPSRESKMIQNYCAMAGGLYRIDLNFIRHIFSIWS